MYIIIGTLFLSQEKECQRRILTGPTGFVSNQLTNTACSTATDIGFISYTKRGIR
jgi:hypothetical protein